MLVARMGGRVDVHGGRGQVLQPVGELVLGVGGDLVGGQQAQVRVDHHGGLDVMVANAGIAVMRPVLDMTLAEWRRQTAVNLDGVFLSVKHAIPAMRRGGGRGCSVVLMSSVAGLRGSAGLAGYSATKGALIAYCRTLAIETAKRGVTVE